MNKPISVVMSTYKEPEEWLNESINSILNQTFSDFEFVIVNDNPERDDLRRILNDFALNDSRIKIVENPKNLGIMQSRNVCVENSTGKYLVSMDADDIALPTRLQVQFDFMEKNEEIGVCGTWAETFGEQQIKLTPPISNQEIRDSIIQVSPFINSSVIIRRNLFDDFSVKYKDLNGTEDYGLWVDLLNFTKFHNIDQVFMKYRVSNQQISYKNKGQKEASWKIKQRAIKTIFGEAVETEIYNNQSITLSKIKKIKKIIPNNISTKCKNNLIESLYLSQAKYSICCACNYFFAEKDIKKDVFFKLIKRIFKHDDFYTRININKTN